MAGTIALVLSIAYLALARLDRLPFVLEAIALFVAIRSLFLTLTHIAPFPTRMVFDSSLFARLDFGGDLFFSGHAGLPFLLALLFWDHVRLRCYFLALSVLFAAVVLLGHLHYSIDVASAYFITFGIYHIALKLFPRDHAVFLDERDRMDPAFPSRSREVR